MEMDITPRTTRPSDMKVVRTTSADPKFNPGRRSYIKYRDLGVEAATGGDVRAEIMHIDGAEESRPTGWHYHTADIQILYMIHGWVKIEFPDGIVTLNEGDCMSVPGGVVHQELCSSDVMRLLEFSVPAKLKTVNVEAPEWAREHADAYGEISGPQAAGHAA
jgi:mannose-6-phosphate isomerase-like protein (cupin superfamily)